MSTPFLITILAAVPFVWLMLRLKKLTLIAAIAAALLAIVVVFKTASFLPLLPLLFFFGSSILLERLFPGNTVSDIKDGKPRDLMQVIANGGIYGLVYLCIPFLSQQIVGISQTSEVAMSLYESEKSTVILSRFLMGMGLVSLAVATADTWSSTIGKYFQKTAFDPFRWQKVNAGLSGGMSWMGTLAAFVGSISIGSFLYLLLPDWKLTIPHFIMITLAGFGGMLLDSLLGSRLQKQYFYNNAWHDQPAINGQNEKTRGLNWMSNDMVNLLSNLIICSLLGLIFIFR